MGLLGREVRSARGRSAKHWADEAGRAAEARGRGAGFPGGRRGRWLASRGRFRLAALPARCPEPRWRAARQRMVRRRAAQPRTTRLWTERTPLVELLRYWAGRAGGPATTGRTGRPNGARQGEPIFSPCGQLARAQQAVSLWTTRRAGQGPDQTDRDRTRADRQPRRYGPQQRRADQRQRLTGRQQAPADRKLTPTDGKQTRADQRQAPTDQEQAPADRNRTRAGLVPRRAGPLQRRTDQQQTPDGRKQVRAHQRQAPDGREQAPPDWKQTRVDPESRRGDPTQRRTSAGRRQRLAGRRSVLSGRLGRAGRQQRRAGRKPERARRGPGEVLPGQEVPDGQEWEDDGVGAARASLGLPRTPSSRCISLRALAAVAGAGLGWAGTSRPAGGSGAGLAAGSGGAQEAAAIWPTGCQPT